MHLRLRLRCLTPTTSINRCTAPREAQELPGEGDALCGCGPMCAVQIRRRCGEGFLRKQISTQRNAHLEKHAHCHSKRCPRPVHSWLQHLVTYRTFWKPRIKRKETHTAISDIRTSASASGVIRCCSVGDVAVAGGVGRAEEGAGI